MGRGTSPDPFSIPSRFRLARVCHSSSVEKVFPKASRLRAPSSSGIFGNALAVSENTSMLTIVANRIESLAFMTGGGRENYKKAVFRFLLLA